LTTVPASAPVSAEPAGALLRLEGVEQFYGEKIRILGPIDLEVREGEFLSLVGPSGCGKSTLLRIATGVLRPTAGPGPHGRAAAERVTRGRRWCSSPSRSSRG
jgi:NitT/TauT family transport system ATP-binding protein